MITRASHRRIGSDTKSTFEAWIVRARRRDWMPTPAGGASTAVEAQRCEEAEEIYTFSRRAVDRQLRSRDTVESMMLR
jgi:hypothetical protein